MKLHISINGRDIEEYGLVALDGTINTLVKPADYKKLQTNSNVAFDGVMPVISANRKKDSRTFTLNFKITSESYIDRIRAVENLENFLRRGTGGGVNEMYVAELNQCYRLIFEGINNFNAIVEDKAIIGVKFMEFCPTAENRVP